MDLNKILLGLGIAVIVFNLLLMSGCIGGDGLEGKYLSEDNPNEYLELNKDGTFYLKEMGIGASGEWKRKGDEITLTFGMGLASKGRINGDVIIDEGGERWIREGRFKEVEKEYEKSVAGSYKNKYSPDSILEIKKDNTYTKMVSEKGWQYTQWGTWKIKGNNVMLTVSKCNNLLSLSPGQTYYYKIKREEGKLKLTDIMSEWIKQ